MVAPVNGERGLWGCWWPGNRRCGDSTGPHRGTVGGSSGRATSQTTQDLQEKHVTNSLKLGLNLRSQRVLSRQVTSHG